MKTATAQYKFENQQKQKQKSKKKTFLLFKQIANIVNSSLSHGRFDSQAAKHSRRRALGRTDGRTAGRTVEAANKQTNKCLFACWSDISQDRGQNFRNDKWPPGALDVASVACGHTHTYIHTHIYINTLHTPAGGWNAHASAHNEKSSDKEKQNVNRKNIC